MLGKIKKIRANLSENMLKSGYFITILHKNSGKLSIAHPPLSHFRGGLGACSPRIF
jgi:hypothetical protein